MTMTREEVRKTEAAIMKEHELRKGKFTKRSAWYVLIGRKWRVIHLQKYKGRLYLFGKVYDGIKEVLPYECTLRHILRTYGHIRSDCFESEQHVRESEKAGGSGDKRDHDDSD